MKHTAAYIIILLMACPAACLRRQAIERSVGAVERPEVEITRSGAALIRSSACDVIMESLDPALWRVLLRSAAYTRSPNLKIGQRLPPLTFVHVIIRNTSPAPLTVSSARIRAGETDLPRLSAGDLGRILASPSYSIFDFNSLLSFRRLLEERDSAALINYDADTVGSLFPFVPPGDTAVTVLAFGRVPADAGSWRVSITVEAGRNKKDLNFDFRPLERRSAGVRAAKKNTAREKYRVD